MNKKIDTILEHIGLDLPSQTGEYVFDAIERKLGAIGQYLSIEVTVKTLEESIKKLKKLTINHETQQIPQATDIQSFDQLFLNCKSLEEVCTKFAEYEYDEDSDKISCLVCEETFEHVGDKMFKSMKYALKRHLKSSNAHATAVRKNSAQERLLSKEDSREKKVGMNLGRLVYFLGKRGKPDEDYPLHIDIIQKAGGDVGDINHSTKFPGKFIQALAKTVEKNVKNHFQTKMKQTGKKPPAKILADKATWKHHTRNIVGIVSVFPDSPKLIQAVYAGAPVCPKGDGESLRDNTASVTDKFISGEQYMGGSVDGATLHCNFGPLMDEHYGRQGIWDWDPLHCAGLVDTHMRKDPTFQWLNDMTADISRCNKFFNIGKEFHHFFEVVHSSF